MEDEEFEGCISCMKTNDLSNLFAVYGENNETYAKMLESCFSITIANDMKYICAECVQRLEDAISMKEQTLNSMALLQGIKDEEYLDEALLEEDEKADSPATVAPKDNSYDSANDTEEDQSQNVELCCVYCDVSLPSRSSLSSHERVAHGIQLPAGGLPCEICSVVLESKTALRKHMDGCRGSGRQFPCHFCDNIYSGRKACYTHLRMKHGLKLSTEQTPKYTPRVRKKCHICSKDFSQKQLLNKHLWKEHGYEVEKRKAFLCPLCDERVSYGHHFDEHLLKEHRLKQHIEHLEFPTMDSFLIYKSQIQEETKCRFRKTTASKHTIEGLRSHYMCSQSGVYVYQGKGIRPAPERQIYKTGKACPAHMVLTQTARSVTLVFHMTHVGHGACPYYEPREPRKTKEFPRTRPDDDYDQDEDDEGMICDACGLQFVDGDEFKAHITTHGVRLFPCHYCDSIFQNVDSWTRHLRAEHNIGTLF